ncbi:hypothetical protein ACIRRA_06805 [Nocardia sp. NPDC101769]|uniref:hypothetical protein n=1 Tax=Nocardia sp. NPDC101769 TaxID=3364333 RepID=UPI00382631AD
MSGTFESAANEDAADIRKLGRQSPAQLEERDVDPIGPLVDQPGRTVHETALEGGDHRACRLRQDMTMVAECATPAMDLDRRR